MSVKVLDVNFQPFEEKKPSNKFLPMENLPSEAFIVGELSNGWRYCIRGIRDPHEEWFFKTQKAGTEEDLMPNEVLSILEQLTSFLPNEIPLLMNIQKFYQNSVFTNRQHVAQMASNSFVGKTEPVTHLIGRVDPETQDEYYRGVLKGPLFYQLVFSTSGKHEFVKSASQDMNNTEQCSKEEVLFILQSLISKSPNQAPYVLKLINKLHFEEKRQKQEKPAIRLLRYDGVSAIDKKKPELGAKIMGETNQFYFQLEFFPDGYNRLLKAKLRNMRNGEKLTVQEIVTLIPQIAAKEKNATYKKVLCDIVNENQTSGIEHDKEALNTALMTQDLSNKTENLENVHEETTEFGFVDYVGFLKGGIFFRFRFSDHAVQAHKATNPEISNAVPLSRKEVNFILSDLEKKYPNSKKAYQIMREEFKNFWKWEDKQAESQKRAEKEQRREEARRKQAAEFERRKQNREKEAQERLRQKQKIELQKQAERVEILTKIQQEISTLASIEEIAPVLYQDTANKRHITWKQAGQFQHIALDSVPPVFATITADGYQRLSLDTFQDFIEIMYTRSNPEILALAGVITESYGKTMNTKPTTFSWEKVLAEDVNRLTAFLKNGASITTNTAPALAIQSQSNITNERV